MHLADFDPALVTNQVWTDPRQIEERLAELAAHMETVTQKYLRNEYATIEAYNAVAGEVAEPYRVLVVADFPTKFDEKSAGRLAAIAAGGVPCGVLTLVAVDTSKTMPSGFALDELRPHCAHLTWNGRPRWPGTTLISAAFPLTFDPPAAAEFATRQIHKIGAAARDAKRVEVPFEFIAPPRESWWTRDSRAGIDVPLGKAGATKRQHLTLGQGTSQHVLIAGRTGSGKSTLMHALITNLALNYSPDEIDLYLIDFKKGVEFKVYATYELPHASVVAIESEREFGISVLQRLDAGDAAAGRPVPRCRRARPQRLSQCSRHASPAPDPAGRRRIPGVLRRGRQARPGGRAVARPPGPPGPGLRRSRPAWLADAGRGVHPGPQHPGPDGCAHRPAMQRGRRTLDPEPRTTWPPSGCPDRARPSTTTPTERPRETISSRSSGSPTSGEKTT